MKRPLVAVVSAYVIGLLLAQLSHPPLTALFAASGCALVLVCLFAKFRAYSVWSLFALIGWTNFAAHTAVLWPQDLRNQLSAPVNRASPLRVIVGTHVQSQPRAADHKL